MGLYDEVLGFLKSTTDTTALVTQRSEACTFPGMKWGEGLLRGEGDRNSCFFHTGAMGKKVCPREFLGTAVQRGGGLVC